MPDIKRREFLGRSTRGAVGAIGAASLTSILPARAQGANEKVVLALIGCGGRGRSLISGLSSLDGVETKCVCDVEGSRLDGAVKMLEDLQGFKPKAETEMRRAFEDPDVDGVVIATPEHWHALATVWACQAEKDVYVEKNISLSIQEGRKMVEAARKHDRVVQCGTQNRSMPAAWSARKYIESGGLGRVVHVQVYNLLGGGGWSPSADTAPPEDLDWDAWLGPAPKVPYNPGRHRGAYNWWDYSGGILAGDGSHNLDLARLVLGDPPHPASAQCIGGRIAFDDERETPDMQSINYQYNDFTLTCTNGTFAGYMAKSPGEVRFGNQFPAWPQNATRIEIYGTKRMMYLGRHGGGWQVLEGGMNVVEEEPGMFPDKFHQPNFIDCIRSRNRPNGDIEQGHMSATLVHLGNISVRVGQKQLMLDPESERFTNCDEANALVQAHYRGKYSMPDKI